MLLWHPENVHFVNLSNRWLEKTNCSDQLLFHQQGSGFVLVHVSPESLTVRAFSSENELVWKKIRSVRKNRTKARRY